MNNIPSQYMGVMEEAVEDLMRAADMIMMVCAELGKEAIILKGPYEAHVITIQKKDDFLDMMLTDQELYD